MTQTCNRPDRLLVKAILLPSGDHAGSASAAADVVGCACPVPLLRIA